MAIYKPTFAVIQSNVIGKLRMDSTADSTLVKGWINQAYQEVLQQTGALETTGTTSLTSGTSSYALPTGLVKIRQVVFLYSDGTQSLPLQRVRFEKILTYRYSTLAQGERVTVPLYALVGQDTIEIWPTPGTNQTLKYWYSYLDDALSGDSDTCDIEEPYGSKLLEYGALVEGARYKKDPNLPDYEQQYQVWLRKYQQWSNRRQAQSSQSFDVWLDAPWVEDLDAEKER